MQSEAAMVPSCSFRELGIGAIVSCHRNPKAADEGWSDKEIAIFDEVSFALAVWRHDTSCYRAPRKKEL